MLRPKKKKYIYIFLFVFQVETQNFKNILEVSVGTKKNIFILLKVLIPRHFKKCGVQCITVPSIQKIVFELSVCTSVRFHKLVVTWLSMSPFDPYVAK